VPDRLDEQKISSIDFEDITEVSYKDIVASINSDKKDIWRFKPKNICKIDPRNNQRIVYSEVRAKRPHDDVQKIMKKSESPCVVCNDQTTGIIDKAPLSEGFTFINKNLFPIVYPENYSPERRYMEPGKNNISVHGESAAGMHFVQWSSNYHDRDISNMPLEDVEIVLQRLAKFEGFLLHASDSQMPSTKDYEEHEHFGYAGIIKNYGRLVGGSLFHDHQQIIHTNIMPGKIKDDLNFRERFNINFSDFMLKNNPDCLTLKELETIKIIVPYFMKRPLDTMIIFKKVCKNYLHDLNKKEISDLALALQINLRAVPKLMEKTGREPAYNVIFHNGPSVGLYAEILPYTQETGGYEHSGIYICQGSPELTVSMYEEYFTDY